MHNIRQNNNFYAYVLFILWPLLALLFAIKNYKISWAKNIIWLFVIFYGYTLVISNEGIDANSYRDAFLEAHKANYSFSDWRENLFTEELGNVDLIQSFINFILSGFTDNYNILFAVYGFIFGFFYSRNIGFLLDRVETNLGLTGVVIMLIYPFVIGFWNINGFRFWTAAHIFIYAVLPFLIEGKKQYLWLLIICVLFHFSFALPVVVVIAYIFLGNKLNIFFYTFILTLFFTEIDLSNLREYNSLLPDILRLKTEGYLNDEYNSAYFEAKVNNNWYSIYYGKVLRWTLYITCIILYLKGKRFILKNKSLLSLFSFTLLFYSFANMALIIPSGGRFALIGNMLILSCLFFFIQIKNHEYLIKNMIVLCIPAFLLFDVVSFRLGFETIGLFTIIANPVTVLFIESKIALIDLIK